MFGVLNASAVSLSTQMLHNQGIHAASTRDAYAQVIRLEYMIASRSPSARLFCALLI